MMIFGVQMKSSNSLCWKKRTLNSVLLTLKASCSIKTIYNVVMQKPETSSFDLKLKMTSKTCAKT